MKLYEVNQSIEELVNLLEPDPETGEVPMNFEELLEQLNGLQMERGRILEFLAKLVLNTRAEASAVRDEEKRLAERRHRLERKDERLMAILDRECAGEKTDLGVATVRYRKVPHVEVMDSASVIQWLRDNGHEDCYRVKEPEVSKTDVKKLLVAGEEIPGVELRQELSCSLG